MAVLFVSPYVYFTDDDGAPLAGGKVYTYAAGTTAPKATYTTAAGDIENQNPVELDASGRAVIFIDGAYKFKITDANDVVIRTVDNVSSFTTLDSQSDPFFESFSGNGTQTAFTMSEDLGTEEKAIYVWVDSGLLNHVTNGTFATDTGWTKGSGWTIAAGVATATGAISTAIEQTAGVTLIAGESYNVTMTITQSAGSLTPSVGGRAGTARNSSGTYTETIIAGSTQTIAFTGSGFTGTLDSVTVTPAVGRGYTIVPPTGYTINGTALTFNTAPATGTGNILVSAPLLSVGAASSAAAAAQAAEAAALAAADIAVSASGFTYKYDTDTTASDPGAGFLRFNNATLASATALYISETTDDAQGIAAEIATWDNSTSTIRGTLRMFKQSNPAVFAIFSITGTLTDNGTWDTITIAYVTGSGSFSDNDPVTIQYVRNGDKGDQGDQGVPGAFLPIADAGGTVDAITANYSPDVVVADKLVVAVVAAGANTSTTPTFSPDGATARTIVKKGGQALVAGDIAGAGATILLEYNSANTRWELLNPMASSASGWVPIKTVTASNVATVDFVNGSGGVVLDGTYKAYVVVCSNIKAASDGVNLQLRTSTDGGSSYDSGSNYRFAIDGRDQEDALVSTGSSTGQAQINLVSSSAVGNDATESLNGQLIIYDPASSGYTYFMQDYVAMNASSVLKHYRGGSCHAVSADVDAIRFFFSSGNISSGTFTLYGMASA